MFGIHGVSWGRVEGGGDVEEGRGDGEEVRDEVDAMACLLKDVVAAVKDEERKKVWRERGCCVV